MEVTQFQTLIKEWKDKARELRSKASDVTDYSYECRYRARAEAWDDAANQLTDVLDAQQPATETEENEKVSVQDPPVSFPLIPKETRIGFTAATDITHEDPVSIQARFRDALAIAESFSSNYGVSAKAWVIDQMCRALLGDKYEEFVAVAKNGPDGPDTYYWDEGVAP